MRGLCRLPYSQQLPGRSWASRGEPGVTSPHLGRPGPARGCCLLGWGPAFSASDVPPVRYLRDCPGWGGAGRSLAPRGGSAGVHSLILTEADGGPCLGPGRAGRWPRQTVGHTLPEAEPGLLEAWRGQARLSAEAQGPGLVPTSQAAAQPVWAPVTPGLLALGHRASYRVLGGPQSVQEP